MDVPLATKFIYLKSLLYGDAISLVEHLLQGSDYYKDNYHAVWTMLNDCYENKKRLFSNALNSFLDLSIMDGKKYKYKNKI